MNSKYIQKIQEADLIDWVSKSLFFLAIVLVIIRQFYLLNYLEFGDESETIVVAKMMASGSKLYKDIFNHHGPLTFLTGFILESIGNFGIAIHRVPIMILQWIALISLYFSPINNNKVNQRLNFIIVSTFMIIFLSKIFGHMYLYQTICGLFSFIALTQYTLPSVLNINQKKSINISCAALVASLPFLAITYLPVSILFFITSIRKNNLKESIIGIIIAIIFNLLFLICFGSINGYMAYHIYLNSHILSAGQSILDLINNAIIFATRESLGFSVILYLLVVTSILQTHSKELFFWRGIFIAFTIAAFWIRGCGWWFHGLPTWYALLAVTPVFFISSYNDTKVYPFKGIQGLLKKLPLLIISFLCIVKLASISRSTALNVRNYNTEFSKIVKTITNKEDKILVLTFRNYEYIASDRLPASAHFFYLPFQAYYNQSPKYGIYTNLKDDIIKNKPKIILADKWKVWDIDKYAWLQYASDIEEVLQSNYYKIPNKPYYIRKDIKLENYGLEIN